MKLRDSKKARKHRHWIDGEKEHIKSKKDESTSEEEKGMYE